MPVRPSLISPEPRAGRWARRAARRRQWETFTNAWWIFVVVGGLIGAMGLLLGLFYDGWLSGFVCGATMVFAIGIPAHLLTLVSGTGPQIMGAVAEGWTAEELGRAVRGRARVFDHVGLLRRDIDHVVLSPTRALAIETKWSGMPWAAPLDEDQRVHDAVYQVMRNAKSVKVLLRCAEVSYAVPVEQVVVLWGGGSTPEGDAVEIKGCPVVQGRDLARWARDWIAVEPAQPTAEFNAGCKRLDSFLENRDGTDDARDPLPLIVRHGLMAPATTSILLLIASISSVFVAASVMVAVQRGWIGIAGGLFVSAAIGVILLRLHRVFGAGWLIGVGLALVATSLAVVVDVAG